MIAASDPQEFVPSGRQLTARHPGPLRVTSLASHKLHGPYEDFLLDKFEKVSIKEKQQDAEWWVLRKSPSKYGTTHIGLRDDEADITKSHVHHRTYGSEFYDSSLNKSKRISDINLSKFSNKHDSSLNKNNETASSCHTAKSTTSNNKISRLEPLSEVKSEVSYTEEELYVKGNTVIWSKGLVNDCDSGLDNGRVTICSYTSPFPVKHALWCVFHCERPTFDTSLVDVEPKSGSTQSTPVPAVCIIDTFNIRVFTPKGEDFVISLPFQIGKVWSTKYGILIEKDMSKNSDHIDEGKSMLYSLAYPLDEVCPVAVNVLSHIQLSGSNLQVVYVSEEPSICVIFDTETKQHSIYKIRKIKPSEKMEITDKMESAYPSFSNQSNKLKSRFSMWECVKNSNLLTIPSPMNSRPASVASFSNVHQSKSHSSMATISRCQSPAVSSVGSPWMPRLSRLQSDVQFGRTSCLQPNSSIFDCTKTVANNFISPNVCLEYLWTEPSNQDDNFSGPASKVFLCDDLTGQWYLCYILPLKFQLFMLRVDFTNGKMNFGMLTSISAKDAVPIPGLHLMSILEHNGNVTLYSGLNPVGKLHIGGTLVQHTPSPYVRKLSQFNSPFPRRSSLLPHCRQSDPKFEDHLLSPVLPEGSGMRSNLLQVNFQLDKNVPKTTLHGLQDAIENRLTLRYSDGTYYRIILPHLSENPLVERCLLALRQCLVRDTASVVLTRWYATKNALGTHDVNLTQEWEMFETLLFELLGYDEEHSEAIEDCPVTPSCNPKRQKHSTCGSDDDWNSMLDSQHQRIIPQFLNKLLNFESFEKSKDSNSPETARINTKSLLFPSIKLIHYVFHLLYEDLKLDTLKYEETQSLGKFLNKLSRDLGSVQYSLKYCKDFPKECAISKTQIISQEDMKFIIKKPFMDEGRPNSVADFLNQVAAKGGFSSYPYIKNVNARSRDIIQVYGVIMREVHPSLPLENLISSLEFTPTGEVITTQSECPIEGQCAHEQATLLMTQRNFTPHFLDTLPFGVFFIFYSTLWKCRENPPSDWPIEAYTLLWRDDLAAQTKKVHDEDNANCDKHNENCNKNSQAVMISDPKPDSEQIDGMEDINNPLMKLRFPDDIRVLEARNMLQSSKPVPIVLVQRPDVSDHDFIEEQEKHLYAVCTRTLALSTGRGMFTLRTSTPVITEPLQSPQMCLTGKVPPKDTTVELLHIDTPSNMNLWPLFHNGVANGLRITPDAQNVDNTWIIFNKPKTSVEQQMEHAGFLMALGLNGHLKNLHVLSTYDYLIKLHEMTSIGILLGLSASFRGTSHLGLTKTLSIHVEALLPPTSMELDVQQNVQVAALLGVGLVYQGTSHRHIIEVLLSEIGRPPGPEMENSVDRESYSLAAGLSLGLVTLKQGDCSLGLSDLNVPDTLHYYMIGGNRRPLTGSQKDKYKVPSFQIREGSTVNLDVTAPGATIALGLMYLGTGNKAVADWMAPPETQYLLDFVRPDFLMFRILARALIMWNEIEPTQEWIESQVPNTVRPYCMVKPTAGNMDVDYEAMNQAYCNIVAGACFALGLKHAGSADEQVFETLLHYCHMFTKLTVKSTVELAGKPTVETCLNVLLLSISMVMAGTGNLEIMRLVRLLRKRVGVASSTAVTYGSHLAIHMALGLLFLGGGRYTLSNSPESIAVLICAFYPKFPTHSNDNRYHLQAFRHLYVLAVEPRLVIPKDINSLKRCYANLRIVRLDGSQATLRGPCILPDLNNLYKVAVDDERYWPVVFERGRNWDVLKMILATTGFIEVKQRAGCLNYITDKFGYHSQLARTLTQSDAVPWDPPPSSIESFTNDEVIKCFCDHFLKRLSNCVLGEDRMRQILTKVTYEAVVKDKLPIVSVFASIIKMIQELDSSASAMNLEQFKLMSQAVLDTPLGANLVSSETMLALHQEINGIVESWENDLMPDLKLYLQGQVTGVLNSKFVSYVTYYDIPYGCLSSSKKSNFLDIVCKLRSKLPARTLRKLTNFL